MRQGRGNHRFASGVGAVVLLASVCALAHGYVPPKTDWLNIKKFVAATPDRPDRDSFVMSGSFNMAPISVVPWTSDVTLHIENWSVTVPAAAWVRQGESNKYKAKQGQFRGEITYWVGASSRCTFKFAASKQDLQSQIPSFPEVPVRLQIGATFDVSALAMMEELRRGVKMVELGPPPHYVIDKIQARLNQKKPNSDGAVIQGRICITEGVFNPDTDVIILTVGTYVATIPAGSIQMPTRGNTIKYKATLPDNSRLSLLLNTDSGRIVFWVNRADLSALASPSVVILEILGVDNAYWQHSIWFKENHKGTVLSY